MKLAKQLLSPRNL